MDRLLAGGVTAAEPTDTSVSHKDLSRLSFRLVRPYMMGCIILYCITYPLNCTTILRLETKNMHH